MTGRHQMDMTDPAPSQTIKGLYGAGSVMSVSYMFPYQSSSSGASSVDSTFGGMA